MAFTEIDYEVEDGILTLTLDREEHLNAFTNTMRDELIAAFDRADEDDDVRAVIVTGRGRAFCAGADLAEGEETFAYEQGSDDALRDGGGRVSLRIYESTKPVIAAINGHAVGVGITMTLPMDVRLVARGAKIGFVFTRRGIVPEACSSWFLPRVVGMAQAQQWVLTGRVFDADEALAGGLVTSVHEPGDVLDEARALAREIAENCAPVSVAMARQMLWRMLGADHPMEAHKVDSRAMADLGGSVDAREGVESFLAKRPPEFRMRPSRDMPSVYPWWRERPFE